MKGLFFFIQLLLCLCLNIQVTAQNYVWSPVGPAPQENSSFGPVSGRVWGASISPPYTIAGVSNPAMMFIAVDQGGVWRSKNFTSAQPSWEPLFDKLPELYYAETITVDPVNPNRLLVPAAQRMILVSENSGDSWDTLAKNVYGSAGPASRLMFDPTDATGNTMYGINGGYAGGDGVYKTTNGGQTWRKIRFPVNRNIHALEYTLSGDNRITLYAGLGASGIWQSIDTGATWQKMTIQLTDITSAVAVDSSLIGRISLAADHSAGSGKGIYALITNNGLQHILNAFKLAGGSWQPIANKLREAEDYNADRDHGLNSSSTFQACGISEEGIFYASAGDPQYSPVYQKKQTEVKWYDVANGINGFRPHTDIHCFIFYEGKTYATCDGGIYRFNPLANGKLGRNTWESLNSNSLQTILVTGIGVHPTNPDVVLCGSWDNGIGLAGNNVWSTTLGGDNSKVLFDPTSASGNEQYAYTTGVDDYVFFFRSKDGGVSWEDKSPSAIKVSEANVGMYAPFAIHPDNLSRIVIGIDRIYESTDKGSTWSNAKSQIFNPSGTRPSGKPFGAPATAIAYGKDNVIWVAYGGMLFRTINDGGNGAAGNWNNMNNGINFGGAITKIVVDPKHSSDVFLLVNNNTIWKYQLFYNKIGGSPTFGWINITSNLPNGVALKTLSLVPASVGMSRGLFVGTSIGAFMSADNGYSWRKFNNGLPPGWVEDIQYFPPQKLLYAGLYGRGVYRTSLKEVLDETKKTGITILEKKGDCDLGAVEGSTTRIGFLIANQNNNQIVNVRWSIDGGITQPGETFDGREISVTIPEPASDIGVSVELEFADGLKLGKYLQLSTHTQQESSAFYFICNLLKERKKPIPWWQWNPLLWTWDPKTDEIIRKKVTRDELIRIKNETQNYLIQLNREIEMFK